MLVADGVAEAAAGAGAAEPEDEVEREEEGRPAGTEPTREERSNKLTSIPNYFKCYDKRMYVLKLFAPCIKSHIL